MASQQSGLKNGLFTAKFPSCGTFTSLCLSLPICKMGKVIATISGGSCDDKWQDICTALRTPPGPEQVHMSGGHYFST